VAGADIPLNSDIGGGLQLTHPNGVVIFPGAVIGPNCLISQQVTIGVGGPKPDAPVIGGHVDIGAGAKILGGVKIGDHARIGANAVALQDVPSGATAAGVPARIVRSRSPILNHDGTAKKKARRTVPLSGTNSRSTRLLTTKIAELQATGTRTDVQCCRAPLLPEQPGSGFFWQRVSAEICHISQTLAKKIRDRESSKPRARARGRR